MIRYNDVDYQKGCDPFEMDEETALEQISRGNVEKVEIETKSKEGKVEPIIEAKKTSSTLPAKKKVVSPKAVNKKTKNKKTAKKQPTKKKAKKVKTKKKTQKRKR